MSEDVVHPEPEQVVKDHSHRLRPVAEEVQEMIFYDAHHETSHRILIEEGRCVVEEEHHLDKYYRMVRGKSFLDNLGQEMNIKRVSDVDLLTQ